MVRKALTTKWKVIISCLLIVVAMAGSGAMAWAIAKHYFKQDYNYEITAVGNRHVNANIKSYSYLAGSSDPYETLATKTFNGTTTETTALSFTKPLIIENDEKVSKFRFEIENTSPYSTSTDLIIKVNAITQDKDNLILTWYYSIDNTNYYVYTGEYLVGHKGDTTILELRVLATETLEGTANISDKVSIELFSELEPPTDFEYEYDYDYNASTTTATKTKVCNYCNHTYPTQTLDESEYVFFTDAGFTAENKIENKVIFLSSNIESCSFAGGLENVVIESLATTSNYYFYFLINGDNSSKSEYKNVTFRDLEMYFLDIFFDMYSGDRTNVTVASDIKFIDVTFLTNEYKNNITQPYNTTVNNILIRNSLFTQGTSTIQNVNNLKIINSSSNSLLTLNNVNNIIISQSSGYISLSNIGGNISIINNIYPKVWYIDNFTNVLSNSYIRFENNDTDYEEFIIENINNSTIVFSNNSYSTYAKDFLSYKLKGTFNSITIDTVNGFSKN